MRPACRPVRLLIVNLKQLVIGKIKASKYYRMSFMKFANEFHNFNG